MMNLDPEQLRAVVAASPTLVNAAAGSGKTRCLIAKILRTIEQGASPSSICAITFTNRAANEMKERLKAQSDNSMKGIQVSTIHSLCVRIMRSYIKHTPLKLPFSIYDETNQAAIIKTIVKARNLNGEPKNFISAISNVKSMLESARKEDIIKAFRKGNNTSVFEEEFLIVYEGYQDILWKNNACDFDDLLIYATDCLMHEDCSNHYSDLWKHILVDEFQDTSMIQYKIVNLLYDPKKTKTLFVVGDFNQSVYSWRGANPENINDFIERYKPTVCNISHNYRSGSNIIKLANNFLQFGVPMVSKSAAEGSVSFTKFSSQEDEANKIGDALLRKRGWEDTAILFRVNTRSLLFERAFASRRIPYKIVGALPYYRRRVAKDILSYLKASANRSDLESLIRIVNIPKRGFGNKKQERLLIEGWPYLQEMAKEMSKIKSLVNILDSIEGKSPADAINEVLYRTEYRKELKKDSDHTMLDSFIEVASSFPTIEELILASTFLEEDNGHGVKLMTAHASKGLEFDTVFVVGVEEGLWPHQFSSNTKEEARLFYVACTRAKKFLNISYSRSKLFRGSSMDVNPSNLFLSSFQNFNK